MHITSTFEQYLQSINPYLRIMEYPEHQDIDVLYWKDKRICTIPKGGKKGTWIDMISDSRTQQHQTSDKIAHRSLEGIGGVLLKKKIINQEQYWKYFTSQYVRDRKSVV